MGQNRCVKILNIKILEFKKINFNKGIIYLPSAAKALLGLFCN